MTPPLAGSQLASVVHAATLAPSVLNIQPWRFVARDDGVLELRRDRGRELPVLDPRHRALTVSVGAALLNLRLALACAGRRPEVDLCPDSGDDTLIATIRTTTPALPTTDDVRLGGWISRRRTSRVPYVDQPIAPELVLRLESVAAQERALLRILDTDEAERASELVHAADAAQRADPAVRHEVACWTNRATGVTDGIPAPALGPAPLDPLSLVRDFAMGSPVHGRYVADFEPHPTLAVLLTTGDTVADWVRAGQALERVWLEATAAGLAMSLLTQPLELPHLRWLGRTLAPMGAHPARSSGPTAVSWTGQPAWPQAIIRLGYALEPTAPTPRRSVEEVLTFTPSSAGGRDSGRRASGSTGEHTWGVDPR